MTKKSNPRWVRSVADLSPSTIRNYKQAVQLFEGYHKMSMDKLITEALNEQSERLPEHELKIYDRILDFRTHLLEEGRVVSGVSTYITRIKTLYKKNRVTIPYIPPINEINANRNEVIRFEDYLTKDEIRKGIEYLPLIQKARLLAMVTGGLSNDECANLTTRQFIDSLYQYHKCDDDAEALRWLSEQDNILWIICIKRGKTGKPFYAIMNPECVQMTALAKLEEIKPLRYGRLPRELDKRLYPTDKDYFGVCCRRINRGLNFGMAGGKTRFRPHMFRKFHATAVRGNYHMGDASLTPMEIDELQGRGMTSVQSTYIKSNPKKQKLLYCQVINNVSLWHKYDFRVIDDDIKLIVVDDAEENTKLKRENEKLKRKLEVSQDIKEDIKYLIEDKGIDEVADIVAELLKAS